MATRTLELAEWRPDAPALLTGGSQYLTNAIPINGGYKPMLSFSSLSDALSARCQGHIACVGTDGNVTHYAGDATKLYRMGAGLTSWSDVSNGTYQIPGEAKWSFEFDGYDKVYAANIADPIQVATIASGNFAALSGSPPQAAFVAFGGRSNEFFMAAYTYDAVDGTRPRRVRWPGQGTTTSWTVSAATQADYQDLQGTDGFIQGLVGGEYFTIFTERAIWRADYVGSPLVFEINRVVEGIGCLLPGSIVSHGKLVAFLSEEGFMLFDGAGVTPIGKEKIDRTFAAALADGSKHLLCAGDDPTNNLFLWAFATSSATSGTTDKIYFYNWALKKWGQADVTLSYMASSLTRGYTLEGLDAVSASIDTLPFSLDSRAWTGGKKTFGGFNSSHQFGFFDGAAMTAAIDTVETQLTAYERSMVNNTRPLVEGTAATITVTPITRDRQNDAVTVGTAAAQNAAGQCPLVVDSRYFRGRIGISGGFDRAAGLDVEFTASGSF